VATAIEADGPAARNGFRTGDVILNVDGKAVSNADKVRRASARPRIDKGGRLKDQTEVAMGFLKLSLTGLALLAGSFFL
jgi:S1-C subfamily serine protease